MDARRLRRESLAKEMRPFFASVVGTIEFAAVRLPKPLKSVAEVLLLGAAETIKRHISQEAFQEVGWVKTILDHLLDHGVAQLLVDADRVLEPVSSRTDFEDCAKIGYLSQLVTKDQTPSGAIADRQSRSDAILDRDAAVLRELLVDIR